MNLEIERKLRCLKSDKDVAELIDLLTLVDSKCMDKDLSAMVVEQSKLGTIYLLKFIVLYSKKSVFFFKLLQLDLPGIVLFCYQTNPNDTVILFVEGWRMMGPLWTVVADKALLLIKLFNNETVLRSVLTDLLDQTNEEKRLDQIISTLNVLTSL